MFALPGLLVALVVVGALGGGYAASVGFFVIFYAPTGARVVRAAALEQRSRPYVDAARLLGLSRTKIMRRHILPNVMPAAVATGFLKFAFGLVSLSALTFVGFGSGPGADDWGRMLSDSQTILLVNPWATIGPGAAIVLTAVAMNVIGDWAFERLSARGTAR
jgi:peptide/nickel transport system permease protein